MEINRLKRKSLTNIHTKTHRHTHTTHTRTHTHYDRDFTILLNNLIFYLFASQFQLTVDTSKQITRLKYNIALVLLNSADGRFFDVCGFFRHEKNNQYLSVSKIHPNFGSIFSVLQNSLTISNSSHRFAVHNRSKPPKL